MKIDIFSLESIKNAKDSLVQYQKTLKSQTESSVEQITKLGYDYMMSVVPFGSGELVSSISWDYDEAENKGIIRVGAEYAVFVEFGTGIVGAASPHPEPENWRYDVNKHGKAGWWYYDKKQSRMRWTKGQPAAAFMYKTINFMRNEAPNLTVKLLKKLSEVRYFGAS